MEGIGGIQLIQLLSHSNQVLNYVTSSHQLVQGFLQLQYCSRGKWIIVNLYWKFLDPRVVWSPNVLGRPMLQYSNVLDGSTCWQLEYKMLQHHVRRCQNSLSFLSFPIYKTTYVVYLKIASTSAWLQHVFKKTNIHIAQNIKKMEQKQS